MKYIRTKDKIYEFEGHFAWIDNTYIDDRIISYRLLQVKQTPFAVKEIDIIKQADTIEELCDEFVFVDNRDNDHDLSIFGFEGARDDLLSTPRCKEIELYGAIWTDKGLIYVAKMNEKGELELI